MQVDLVTETDKACEELIFNHLKKHYPDHKVFTQNSLYNISVQLIMLILIENGSNAKDVGANKIRSQITII